MRLQSLWINLDFQLPEWMLQVAKITLSSEQFNEINSSRQIAIARVKSQRLVQSASKKIITKTANFFDSIEEIEFEALVEEIRLLGFQRGSEVSSYIVRRRLGLKYQNISGHLEMSMNVDTKNQRVKS